MVSPDEVNAFLAEHYPAAYASGHRCLEIGEGRVLAGWTLDPATLRPGQLISGPVQFALADRALWFLSVTILGLAPMAVTSDLHITFLRPARGADLRAEAKLLRAGRTRITGEVHLFLAGGDARRVSHAVGSYARLG